MWPFESSKKKKPLPEKINYLCDSFPDYRLVRDKSAVPHGQDSSGYGNKISTNISCEIGQKRYRVYCTHYSNAASFWVVINKKRYHLLSSEHIEESPADGK